MGNTHSTHSTAPGDETITLSLNISFTFLKFQFNFFFKCIYLLFIILYPKCCFYFLNILFTQSVTVIKCDVLIIFNRHYLSELLPSSAAVVLPLHLSQALAPISRAVEPLEHGTQGTTPVAE